MKVCGNCEEEKKDSEFYPTKTGLRSYCIVCSKDSSKKDYQKNLEENKRKKREAWQATADKYNANKRAKAAKKKELEFKLIMKL